MEFEQEQFTGQESLERSFRRRTPEVDLLDVLSGGVESEPVVIGQTDEDSHATLV
jgi:hypothetical protein